MMNNQNLQFNILPFDWPEEEVTFYFHRDVQPGFFRLHRRFFPNKLDRVLPSVKGAEQEFVATSFDRPMEGFVPWDVDLQYDNAQLAKLYFHYKVHAYFKGLGKMVVRNGFGRGVQVWVPAFKSHTKEYLVFECFRLRVQFGVVSSLPELLIRYEREVRVSRQSVAQLIQEVPPALFDWLLVGERLVKYTDYVKEEESDFEKALPVLNGGIKKALGKPADKADPCNLYNKHYRYTRGFYSKFLDNEDFRRVIPIHQEFLRVQPELIRCLPYTAKDFETGAALASKAGLQKLKPYKKSPHSQIHLFFIVHRQHARLIETVKRYFFQGIGTFKGLSQYAQLNIHPQKDMDIIFDNLFDPLPEIQAALDTYSLLPPEGITYTAVYISPYGQCDPAPKKRVIYHRVKYTLLEWRVGMQVLDAAKLQDPKVLYADYLPSISVALLAKLDGIPWRMHVPVKHELVVGVGTYSRKGYGVQYMGAGWSFSNEGRFQLFECFQFHEMREMAGFISYGVRIFAAEHSYPKRLVVHFRKGRNGRELALIKKAIAELTFPKPIPIFFVCVCGRVSEDVMAFDTEWGELMPYSGTIMRVGAHQYLLFNNGRYAGVSFEGEDGLPLPIKIEFDCTDKGLLDDQETVLELVDQVYQYSRIYWRGLRQQNLPVSVLYPEIVARMVANFPGGRLPEGGKRGMWFL